MRLSVTVAQDNFPFVIEKLNSWNGEIVAKDESGNQISVICELDPSQYQECVSLVRNLQGMLDVLRVSAHEEADTGVDHFEEFDADVPPPTTSQPQESTESSSIHQLSEKLEKQSVSDSSKSSEREVKQIKCSACNSLVGDAKWYRDHCKSEWHKHNLKLMASNLPSLSAEECSTDTDFLGDSRQT